MGCRCASQLFNQTSNHEIIEIKENSKKSTETTLKSTVNSAQNQINTSTDFRAGKSYKHCVEDINLIFHKLEIFFENMGGSNKVLHMLHLWLDEFVLTVCKKTGEISHFVSYSPVKHMIQLSHEINGWNDLSFFKIFCKKHSIIINVESFDELQESIKELSPLTVTMSIAFTYFNENKSLPEISSSISITTNILSKISLILHNINNFHRIVNWANDTKSLPIEISFNLTEVPGKKGISYYIFDGDENENMARAISAFPDNAKLFQNLITKIIDLVPASELTVGFLGSYNCLSDYILGIKNPDHKCETLTIDNFKIPKIKNLKAFNQLFNENALSFLYLKYSNSNLFLEKKLEIAVGRADSFDLENLNL